MKKYKDRKSGSKASFCLIVLLIFLGPIVGFWLGLTHKGCLNYNIFGDIYKYFKCPGINIEEQGIIEKPEKLEAKPKTHEYNFSSNRFSVAYDIYAGDDDIEKNINILVTSFLQEMTVIMNVPSRKGKVAAMLVYKQHFKKAAEKLIEFLREFKKYQDNQNKKKLNI